MNEPRIEIKITIRQTTANHQCFPYIEIFMEQEANTAQSVSSSKKFHQKDKTRFPGHRRRLRF